MSKVRSQWQRLSETESIRKRSDMAPSPKALDRRDCNAGQSWCHDQLPRIYQECQGFTKPEHDRDFPFCRGWLDCEKKGRKVRNIGWTDGMARNLAGWLTHTGGVRQTDRLVLPSTVTSRYRVSFPVSLIFLYDFPPSSYTLSPASQPVLKAAWKL